jgi:hypothetical protein
MLARPQEPWAKEKIRTGFVVTSPVTLSLLSTSIMTGWVEPTTTFAVSVPPEAGIAVNVIVTTVVGPAGKTPNGKLLLL